jgi:hypothetical protein
VSPVSPWWNLFELNDEPLGETHPERPGSPDVVSPEQQVHDALEEWRKLSGAIRRALDDTRAPALRDPAVRRTERRNEPPLAIKPQKLRDGNG